MTRGRGSRSGRPGSAGRIGSGRRAAWPALGVLTLALLCACGSANGSNGRGATGGGQPVDTGPRVVPVDTGQALAARDSALMPTGLPADSLPDPSSPGAGLVVRYCSSCHGIPSPRRHAAADWPATVRRMVLRMNMMGHMRGGMGMMMGRGGMAGRRRRGGMMAVGVPTAAEVGGILSYLESHAMPAADTAKLPAASGRALFSGTCSKCHALPAPAQHTAAQWPGVVERMRQHMQQMGVGSITDRQAAEIVAYLRRAGG